MTCQAGNLEASTALIKRGVLVHMPNKVAVQFDVIVVFFFYATFFPV